MTYEQAFLKIKEKFDNADASNVSDFAIQITFMDEDCSGIFYAEVKDGALYVEPYDYNDNSLAITITKSALLAYLGGRSSLDKAIANGDAYVERGDVEKMEALKSTIKKAPAKKTPAKKAPAKKTETKTATKKAPAKKTETKTAAKAAPAKKTETKVAPAKKAEPKTTAKPVETKTTTKTTATKTTATKPASKTTK